MPCDLMLIAYDGSEHAKRAIEYAGRFLAADRAVVLTAWEPMVRQAARISGISGMVQPEWVPDEELEDIAYTTARDINAEGVHLAALAGLNAESRLQEYAASAWQAVVEVADELDVDIIVAGTRGATGLRALVHSSVADAVLKHCHRPVFLVPPVQPAGARKNGHDDHAAK
ncbi:universal stress protein [Nocardia fusca]|jgi:nucleotide-binding universal stress UspA family protein|uniref:Universal stress protein n=1 Tax=Nocardia fusca TaxID=941183 RepID=A0ABV3F6A6_9NOCA